MRLRDLAHLCPRSVYLAVGMTFQKAKSLQFLIRLIILSWQFSVTNSLFSLLQFRRSGARFKCGAMGIHSAKCYLCLSLASLSRLIKKNNYIFFVFLLSQKLNNISGFSMYCIILLKSTYWFYSSKIVDDDFSIIKIILRFLSLQVSATPLNYVIQRELHLIYEVFFFIWSNV